MVNERVAIVVGVGASDAVVRAATEQDAGTGSVFRSASPFAAPAWTDRAIDWVWLLDGSAVPRGDALRRLLEAADAASGIPGPALALLASKTLTPAGTLDPGGSPWYRRGGATDLAMRAARVGLLPVRAARAGSLLVRREAGADTGPGRARLEGPGAAMEWTGRLLRDRMGYLAPLSVTDAALPATWPPQAVGRGGLDDLKVTAAMLAGPGWRAREKLWLTVEGTGRAADAVTAWAVGAARR